MEETKPEKIQRNIKLKTLDNKITELTVDREINIKDLKKLISQKFNNIEIERERLIFKGKQLKDEEKLSDHIKKDNEIIHLMFKTIEQAQNNQNTNQNNSNNTNNNLSNSFSNVLSGLLNNTSVMNLTNVIFGNVEGSQNQPIAEIINRSSNPNAGNILLQQEQNRNNNNIRAQTRIININTSQTNQNNNNNNNNSNNNNQNLNNQNESNNQNLNLSIEKINENNKFPISISQVDKNYEHLLKDTNLKINKAVEDIRQEVTPINLPLLNSNQNALTAISRTIRHYCLLLQEITPSLIRLSELMEREQFIPNINDRKNANELLKKCTNALNDISSSSESLKKILKAVNFGESPNTGYINVISTDFGVIATNQRGETIDSTTLLSFNGPNPNPSNNNNQSNVINLNNTNNNRNENQNRNNNNNLVNNIMQQLMSPNNLNNIAGIVGNIVSNVDNNNNSNNNTNYNSNNNVYESKYNKGSKYRRSEPNNYSKKTSNHSDKKDNDENININIDGTDTPVNRKWVRRLSKMKISSTHWNINQLGDIRTYPDAIEVEE